MIHRVSSLPQSDTGSLRDAHWTEHPNNTERISKKCSLMAEDLSASVELEISRYPHTVPADSCIRSTWAALLVWHGVGTSHILCWRAPKESHKSHHLCVTKGWGFDIRDTRTQLIWQKHKLAVKCAHLLFIWLSRGRDALGALQRVKICTVKWNKRLFYNRYCKYI